MLELNHQHILDLKHLIVRARKKCDAGYEGLLAVAERLRSWYLMSEFNLLQEGMHLQDELFDNYEDMCKASHPRTEREERAGAGRHRRCAQWGGRSGAE